MSEIVVTQGELIELCEHLQKMNSAQTHITDLLKQIVGRMSVINDFQGRLNEKEIRKEN